MPRAPWRCLAALFVVFQSDAWAPQVARRHRAATLGAKPGVRAKRKPGDNPNNIADEGPQTSGGVSSGDGGGGGGARLLWCECLGKSYDGQRYQFRDLSLGVSAGNRLGLVGVNGVGKSTLMKCLAGIDKQDLGTVGVEGRPSIIYVEQEPAGGKGAAGAVWTVADALTQPMVAGPSASSPAAAKVAAGLRALRAFWGAAELTGAAMAEALEGMEANGGWELETRLEMVAGQLGGGGGLPGPAPRRPERRGAQARGPGRGAGAGA